MVLAGAAMAIRQTITVIAEISAARITERETWRVRSAFARRSIDAQAHRPGRQFSGAFGLVDPRKERDRRLDAIAGLEARAKRRIRRRFIDAEQFK